MKRTPKGFDERHIKTLSQRGDKHLLITNCNRASFTKLALCGLQEVSNNELPLVLKFPEGTFG